MAGQAQPAGAQQLVRVYLPLPALQAVVALLDALAVDGLEAGLPRCLQGPRLTLYHNCTSGRLHNDVACLTTQQPA